MSKKQKVLVTGAGGFIGSHLVETLIEKGYHVRAFLRYTSHNSVGWLEELPPKYQSCWEPHFGDLTDAGSVREAVRDCDRIFHLAALIGIPYSYVAPGSYVDVNIRGTLNILEAARSLLPSRILITSTSEVYGSAQFIPITEQHPLHPQSPYAASKIGAESLATSYFHSFGLPVSIVRPFNTFGPRQGNRAILPSLINQALSGDTIRVGNQNSIRDMVFVKDTVEGILAVAQSDACIGEVTNLATGKGHSVGQMIDLVKRLVGCNLPVLEEASRLRPESSEVTRLIGSAQKAEKLTGWKPRISLEEGIAQSIPWFRNRKESSADSFYRV